MAAPVRVGVVGLGQRGLQHLAALTRLQAAGQVQVSALCDVFPANLAPEKLQRFVPGLDTDPVLRTRNFADVCDPAVCQALFLAIPPNLHQQEVVQAAEAGIHLMVEKPMSLDITQAQQMQDAIETAGVMACCGFQQRYDPRHEAVHAYVQAHRPVFATYAFHASLERHDVKHTDTSALGGPASRVWAASQRWSGTTVVEAGIHPLDLWRYWFGEVDWVQAAYVPRPPEAVVDQADNPYAYSVQFGFANGLVGNLVLSRISKVRNLLSDHRVFCAESQVVIAPDQVSVYSGADPDARALWHGVREEGTYRFAAGFVTAIRHQDPATLKSPFGDGIHSLASVLAANASHEMAGRRIHVQEFLAAARMWQPEASGGQT